MNGIFYVATGEKFLAEALKSVKSLKKQLPNVHVTLYSDKACDSGHFDRNVIISASKFSSQDKVECFQQVDYDKAVFLDTDTYVVEDISDMFELLDHFDFAASLEVARGYWYREWSLPDSFPELNSGVIAFNNTSKTKKLFADWLAFFEESKIWQNRCLRHDGKPWDQPGLRRALFEAKDIRMAVLPSEYNAVRYNGTYLWGKAKIIHSRGNIEEVAERMNRDHNVERSFFQGLGVIADFSRISLARVFETVMRVNACACLDVLRRTMKPIKNWARRPEVEERLIQDKIYEKAAGEKPLP